MRKREGLHASQFARNLTEMIFQKNRHWFCASLLLSLPILASAGGLDPQVKQLIVSIAPDWDSSQGKLQFFERDATSGEWKAASDAWPVLYGRNGLAWGRGVKGQDESGLHKTERDKRAPAGIFEIGKVYGYEPKLPTGASFPYHQVTDADLWSDDPRSPNYNRHVVIDPKNPPDNYSHERMKSGDFAYHWLVEIRHNADPPIHGDGSAIFFHIRRGETRPTSGCTTMAEGNLVKMIRWLRAEKHPHYVLLPWSEYQRKWQPWGLPSPDAVGALKP
jgi:L,D-peptidoglycan transpeptidase YkuD (ErfK/YbiS/YcfS/YnhG family)